MKYSGYDLFGGFDYQSDPQTQWKTETTKPHVQHPCNHCYCISLLVHGRPHGKCCKCGDVMMRSHVTWSASQGQRQ